MQTKTQSYCCSIW